MCTTVYVSSKVMNTLANADGVCQIAGLHDVVINEDKKTLQIFGYNAELGLATWHKAFGAKADSPCRLESLFFTEQGPILMSALHPSLPLFLTVSEHAGGQVVLVSYEKESGFAHAGCFVPREANARQKVKQIFWLNQLPLFCVLTHDQTLKVVGPAIQPIAEDIGVYTSMLKYSVNTCTPYLWKTYLSKDMKQLNIAPSCMLQVATTHDTDQDDLTGVMLFAEGRTVHLGFLNIANVLSQDDLDVHLKMKADAELSVPDEIRDMHVLKTTADRHGAFQVCVHAGSAIQIYAMNLRKKKEGLKCELVGQIPLREEPELIRINTFQIPLIAVMDKEKNVSTLSELE